MCGITGCLGQPAAASELHAIVVSMADQLRHRGPDDAGAWTDAAAGIALGFRRLSIVDLSESGHQPMFSASGRYVIVFNGEVYNFGELKRELSDVAWRGTSDTEVMLAAIEAWGLEPAVRRFNGMFAFALWDRREHRLHLVRDRLGIKPLYYGRAGRVFLFASELKALRAHPAFSNSIDPAAVALFMRYGHVPQPYSIYQQIHKLTPGTILTVASDITDAVPRAYWSAREIAEAGVQNPYPGNEPEAFVELEALLRDSIRLRMIADVPLGAFLSGGIDSSTVVALMQTQSTRPVKTFTIGFNDRGVNEADFARDVACHLATEHTELTVTPAEAMDVIPRLPRIYDEPFADSSQIPTFLVSELARRRVTVSLSGDGGDELFCGYPRYAFGEETWKNLFRLPRPARRGLAALIRLALRAGCTDKFLARTAGLASGLRRHQLNIRRLDKLANGLTVSNFDDLYLSIMSLWMAPESLVPRVHSVAAGMASPNLAPGFADPKLRMMFFDLVTYLPNDILTKLDRASMAVGLEARVPLLDYRIVEFAWRLPHALRAGAPPKSLLRKVLYKFVPREIVDRPKQGFEVPLAEWLRGPLRPWAESLLSADSLRATGLLDPKPIRKLWKRHLSRRGDWEFLLWTVLMFQSWHESLRVQTTPVEHSLGSMASRLSA